MHCIQVKEYVYLRYLERLRCDFVGYLRILRDIRPVGEDYGQRLQEQLLQRYSNNVLICSRFVAYFASSSGVQLSSVVSLPTSLMANV